MLHWVPSLTVEDDGEVCCVGRPRPFDRLRDLRVRGDMRKV